MPGTIVGLNDSETVARHGLRSNPASNALEVTPSDTVDLDNITNGLFITVDGDVVLQFADSGEVTLPVTAGMILPFRVKRVKATGTTATVVALW
jgi:hypothetical protein